LSKSCRTAFGDVIWSRRLDNGASARRIYIAIHVYTYILYKGIETCPDSSIITVVENTAFIKDRLSIFIQMHTINELYSDMAINKCGVVLSKEENKLKRIENQDFDNSFAMF
jgi:hypothetical protein